MIDTHCHLNFSAFCKTLDAVIQASRKVGVGNIIVPGTDIESSEKAVEIAEKYEGIYAAVGVHPHHAREIQIQNLKCKIQNCNLKLKIKSMSLRVIIPRSGRARSAGDEAISQTMRSPRHSLRSFLAMTKCKKVVAIGEIGLDYHKYTKTKYEQYVIDDNVKQLQKELFVEQIKLAIQYDKSLIVHNREARDDFIKILREYWDVCLEGRTVFHCCETDVGTIHELSLLDFAIKHHIFIGIDGDVTYNKEKQEFVKKIPLDLLVLETDSPFLLPEPLRSQKKYPNEPKNLQIINEFISSLINISQDKLQKQTTDNARRLFNLM